jgi:methionyl aminopeptidase
VIVCKSPAELDRMSAACRLVADVLVGLRAAVTPGMTTAELDGLAEAHVKREGGVPAFKGYHGFPGTLCTSVNEEVIHGIPGRRVLREGDIVSIDMGVVLDGFYGDSAITVAVGRISEQAAELMRVTEESLYRGIAEAVVGARVSDIGAAVQRHVEGHGYSVVREFVGHGVGRALHEEPQVPNYGPPGRGPRLAEGMTLAIEPMVAMGRATVKVLDDGWTAITKDRCLSAHFEHTVAVSADGPRIMTVPSHPDGLAARG